MNPPPGWKKVSFAADCTCPLCDPEGEECSCEDSVCSICGLYYSDDCECPGPTQDGYEYETFNGELYAKEVEE